MSSAARQQMLFHAQNIFLSLDRSQFTSFTYFFVEPQAV